MFLYLSINVVGFFLTCIASAAVLERMRELARQQAAAATVLRKELKVARKERAEAQRLLQAHFADSIGTISGQPRAAHRPPRGAAVAVPRPALAQAAAHQRGAPR